MNRKNYCKQTVNLIIEIKIFKNPKINSPFNKLKKKETLIAKCVYMLKIMFLIYLWLSS